MILDVSECGGVLGEEAVDAVGRMGELQVSSLASNVNREFKMMADESSILICMTARRWTVACLNSATEICGAYRSSYRLETLDTGRI